MLEAPSDRGKKKKGSDCNRPFRDSENKLLRVTHDSWSHSIFQQAVHLRDLQMAVTH